MKIALCISGMPRNIENSFKWMKESIIDVLPKEPDIFIHTWNDINNQQMYNLYKPKLMDTEVWSDEFADKLGWQEFKNHKFEIESRASALGQSYKIMKCNNLRLDYEKQNNIKYDVIFRLRTELCFQNKIDIKELEIITNNKDKNIIFLRMGPNPQNIDWNKDNFSFSNNNGMNIYSSFYKYILDISRLTKVNTSELLLRNWLSLNDVLIEHTSCDYILKRD